MHRKKKKLSVPIILKGNLDFNIKTGTYDVAEQGITYHLDLSQMTALKLYFHEQRATSIQQWLQNLTREERNRVQRSGEQPDTEFFNDGGFLE